MIIACKIRQNQQQEDNSEKEDVEVRAIVMRFTSYLFCFYVNFSLDVCHIGEGSFLLRGGRSHSRMLDRKSVV